MLSAQDECGNRACSLQSLCSLPAQTESCTGAQSEGYKKRKESHDLKLHTAAPMRAASKAVPSCLFTVNLHVSHHHAIYPARGWEPRLI